LNAYLNPQGRWNIDTANRDGAGESLSTKKQEMAASILRQAC
jgi:hypothetical protein